MNPKIRSRILPKAVWSLLKFYASRQDYFYMKKVNKDFEELLRLLEKNKVKYMIVGGYAVAFHGFPRFTKDIDIFYSTEETNIVFLRKALVEFGFSEAQIPPEVFTEKSDVLKFGIDPIRVDLLNEIDGVEFSEANKSSVRGSSGQLWSLLLDGICC